MKYVFDYEDIKTAALMEKKFKKSHDVLKRELKKTGISSAVEYTVRDREAAVQFCHPRQAKTRKTKQK